jgi:hypothetical protein
MNVMAFDIFQRFWVSRLRSRNEPAITRKDMKKLFFYILYAAGSPLVITAITAYLQFSDQVPDDHDLKPLFGIRCQLYQRLKNS